MNQVNVALNGSLKQENYQYNCGDKAEDGQNTDQEHSYEQEDRTRVTTIASTTTIYIATSTTTAAISTSIWNHDGVVATGDIGTTGIAAPATVRTAVVAMRIDGWCWCIGTG